jgi:hypothetical protein
MYILFIYDLNYITFLHVIVQNKIIINLLVTLAKLNYIMIKIGK